MKWGSQTNTSGPTWSCHRDQLLQGCERKYYFQYLSDARLNSGEELLRKVALLKKIKNVAMWQGESVHTAIAQYISQVRRGQVQSNEQTISALKARMSREWLFSECGTYRSDPYGIGKTGVALFEHEYGEMPSGTTASAAIDRALEMMTCFFVWIQGGDGVFERIKTADAIWIEPPAWGAEAPGFMIGDVQVITKVDLAVHHRNKEFTVFDWKTGRAPKPVAELSQNEVQINVYMLWASLGLKIPLEQVASRLVYLGDKEPAELKFQLDEERAEQTYRLIEDSVNLEQQWERYFRDKRLGLRDLDYSNSLEECRRCNFKGICRANFQRK
jgi:hypothetical protein